MTLEQHITHAIEAATAELSGRLQERLRSLAADVSQAVVARQALAVEEASAAERERLGSKHAAALDALRAETTAQRELAVSMARTEAAERLEAALAAARADAARQYEAAMAALQAETSHQNERAMAALRAEAASTRDAALASVRADAEREIARARADADNALAHARADADQRLAAAQADAEATLIRTIEAAKAEAAQASGQAIADARASERAGELALTERLADAVRRLDAARSLTEVFDVLVDAGSREVPRVAVFVVRGNTLAGWRAAGFSRDEDPRELQVPLDQAGLLTAALRSGTVVTSSDSVSSDSGASPFGALPAASAGIAVPVRVGGDTVGVLYADDVSARERQSPSSWPESVELLTRHAARCLEVLTVARVTQPVSIPAPSRPTPTPRRYTPQARAFQAGHDDDDDAARRYARLLVSEIKLYHESAVTAGRRDRNLLERLRPEIERARRLYDERVPPPILARTDYFNQEIVRTLANGDESLLGPA